MAKAAQHSICNQCEDVQADIDVGFSLAEHGAIHKRCGGRYIEPWYAVVTFGSPAARYRRVTRNFEQAWRGAESAKGTGSCTMARVLVCRTRAAARDADISDEHKSVAASL